MRESNGCLDLILMLLVQGIHKTFIAPEMKKALVLGTGGASRSVVYALSNMGIRVTLYRELRMRILLLIQN